VHTSWPNAARGWAAALLADARQFRPDLVVCEPVEHAGRVVAAALGVPLVEHGWGFTLPAGGDATASAGLADLYRSVGATPRQPVLRVDLGSASVQSTDAEPAVYRYRYLPWGIPAEALPPPGSTPRVLLTLGTFPHPDAADRLRTAACAAAEVGAELVVVLGHDDRGDDRGWPAGTTVVRRVDLPSEITRCSLVVHHGGAGTAWATLAAGVPAVCLPQAGDQFRNAGLLAEVGAAAVVPPDAADLPTLRRTFTQALTDPALNAGAKRVQRENESLPPVSALVERIEALGPSPAQPAEHVRA
jgi:glycosyltransferase